MRKLRIYNFSQVRRGFPGFFGGGCWVYLGKDLQQRERVSRTLGGSELFPLYDRLHAIAERLRQPFLDFIADLGKMQTDQLGWWSSSCAWKNAGRSDLFLLICYECLVDDLLRETGQKDLTLIVVIEDPWLFRQLRSLYASFPNVQFQGRSSVWPICLKAFFRGVGSRAVWSLRLLRNYIKQMWCWKGQADPRSIPSGIAFYTYPQDRCLRGLDGWTDPYMGDLDKLLEKDGYSICRFSPPEVGGFEQAIAQRSQYFVPLIFWITPLNIVRSVLASWHPVWPKNPEIGGLPIGCLLLREWWQDRWRSSYPIFRIFFESLSNLLRTGQLKLLIYPHENQPWERMLVLAARAHHVSTVGYQHGGGLARFMLPYFYGSGETKWAPLPDLVIASGAYSHELLVAGGIPPERLVMGGNLRHRYVWNVRNAMPPAHTEGRARVLVALPIEPELAQHLIYALRRAFPDGGMSEGIEFAIRPHPMSPHTAKRLKWPAMIPTGTFEEAIGFCASVLYSGSGTGLEALAMGRKVFRYRSELFLNMDRAEFLKGSDVIDCNDYDLREKVLSFLHARSWTSSRHTVDDLLARIFPLPDQEVWLQVVERFCPERS